jgi:sigma-B regulation protein RsbU (phosphoserine phosphatase)
LVVGDVSGKGVGAALYMSLFRTILRVLLLKWDGAPDADDSARLIHAVRFTNEYVARTHGQASMFASLLVGLLDVATGAFTYVNAGHNPPFVVGGEGVRELVRTGIVVGLRAGEPFHSAQAQIAPGETLLFYTDGVTEASSAEGHEYGEARLVEVAAQAQGSVAALLDRVERDVIQFMRGAEQADDITLLAVRRL